MIATLVTELDVLLDTRLGLIDTLDSAAAVRLFKNKAYYLRERDEFESLCGIPQGLYEERWKHRNMQVLRHSINTPATDLVHYGLAQLEHRSVSDPEIEGVSLVVNAYPYQPTKAEAHALEIAIARVAGIQSTVKLIYEPWEAFTVKRCRGYTGLVLYNHLDWFKLHWEELFSLGMPQVTMVVPKLIRGEGITGEMLHVDGLGRELNPWSDGALSMLEYVGLEFVDVKHFCIAHPKVPLKE